MRTPNGAVLEMGSPSRKVPARERGAAFLPFRGRARLPLAGKAATRDQLQARRPDARGKRVKVKALNALRPLHPRRFSPLPGGLQAAARTSNPNYAGTGRGRDSAAGRGGAGARRLDGAGRRLGHGTPGYREAKRGSHAPARPGARADSDPNRSRRARASHAQPRSPTPRGSSPGAPGTQCAVAACRQGAGLREERRVRAPIAGLLRLRARFEIPRGPNGSRSRNLEPDRRCLWEVAALSPAWGSGASTPGCLERPP